MTLTPTMNNYFIDTNIFVALRDKNDSTHKKAQILLNKLREDKPDLFTSSDIIGETLTVLSKKLGKEVAKEFLQFIEASTITEIFITEELHLEARELFNKVSSKNISFIDCSSVIAMKLEKIGKIFSFDQDFKKLGVELFS